MKTTKQIYLHAARLIDSDIVECSCTAVQLAAEEGLNQNYSYGVAAERALYGSVFNPVLSDHYGVGWSKVMNTLERSNTYDPKEIRVLMLCLMAECWKDF